VVARPIGAKGLWSGLYAAVRQSDAERAYLRDFITLLREQVFMSLSGIEPLG
jgi:LysR family transcriptional regulator for metE and metH